MLWLVIVRSSWQFHEFAPPLNALDKGAILGNELSFFLVCFRLFLTAFLKTRSQGLLCQADVQALVPWQPIRPLWKVRHSVCPQRIGFSIYEAKPTPSAPKKLKKYRGFLHIEYGPSVINLSVL